MAALFGAAAVITYRSAYAGGRSFAPWAAPVNASLAYALVYVLLWWALMWALDRSGLRLRV